MTAPISVPPPPDSPPAAAPPPSGAVPPPPPPPPSGPAVPAGPRSGPPVASPAGRGGGRTIVIVLGGLATAVLIVMTALQIVGLLAHEERRTEVVFDEPVERIVMRIDDGEVTLRGGAARVRGERNLSEGLGGPDVTEEVVDGVLTIDVDCPPMFSVWCEASYSLDVPRDVAVEVRSESDSIRTEGIDGSQRLRSLGGSVVVIDAGGSLDLSSEGGGVRGEGLSGDEVRARSTAGRVDLRFGEAPVLVVARSLAAGVTVELPAGAPPYRVEASSSAGSADTLIRTDPSAPRGIEASSAAGDVEVRYTGR